MAQPGKSRILLAEDSPVYRHLISGLLSEWGFDLTCVHDGAEAWNVLQQADPPTLVLLDWVLPKLDGIELCRRIRQSRQQGIYTYTVLLTSKDGKDDLLEGMRAGADDYLIKPFEHLELKARLLAGQRILDLQKELVDARESLRFAATYDSLTKLLNRGEILGLLNREMARAKRQSAPIGIVLVDVDHFKSINDTFGHPAGDEVLRQVASTLKSHLRLYDGAGRYGGEEFLLILPGCDLPHAMPRAEQLRSVIGSQPVTVDNRPVKVTVSAGVTVAHAGGKAAVESLLNQADEALYRAKRGGRDRVEGPAS